MIAGARPGAALPTLTCQLSCGVTLAVSVGNGPGLLLLPNSQPNEGGGIFGSTSANENVVEQALSENHSFRLIDCSQELERLKTAGDLTWPDAESLTRCSYLRTLPGVHPCDGFFAALLERSAE